MTELQASEGSDRQPENESGYELAKMACPQCNRQCDPQDVLCTDCGWNFRTKCKAGDSIVCPSCSSRWPRGTVVCHDCQTDMTGKPSSRDPRKLADATLITHSGSGSNLGQRSAIAGRSRDEATVIRCCSQVLKMANPPPDQIVKANINLGMAYSTSRKYGDARRHFQKVLNNPAASQDERSNAENMLARLQGR